MTTVEQKLLNLNNSSITEQAKVILEHRYLLKDDDNQVIEAPEEMFRRVADAVAAVDSDYMKLPVEVDLTAQSFYDIMSSLEFFIILIISSIFSTAVARPIKI